MLKHAFARGCLKALADTQLINPKLAEDEEIADALAGAGAEDMPGEEADMLGEVAPDTTANLAANLVELSGALEQGAAAAQAAAAEASKSAEAMGETTPATAPQNTLAEGAEEAVETADENAARPAGYANVGVDGVGSQDQSGQGAVGTESDVELRPEAGSSNSAEEAKSAALRNLGRKLAKKLAQDVTPAAAPQNTLAASPMTETEEEAANRPAPYANVGVDGVGNTDLSTAGGVIGKEEGVALPSAAVGGSNSASEMATKSAAEREYLNAFNALAMKYARYLPPRLNDNEKIAAVQYLMGMPPKMRDAVALQLTKSAEMPEGLAQAVAAAKEEPEESESSEESAEKDEKKKKEEEKKEEEKAAAARGARNLLGRVRNLQR